MRKLILAAITVLVLAAATPALAQLAGNWDGVGTGTCTPPSPPFPPAVLQPWSSWTGVIPPTEDSFTGTWTDGAHNGRFYHTSITIISSDIAIIDGKWTWRITPTKEATMGTFHIIFYCHNRVCSGSWASPHPTVPPRTIQGDALP
ncbi:hypothetical protein GX441_08625 [bacterium]|nr:hypothetical protein [bacterium]